MHFYVSICLCLQHIVYTFKEMAAQITGNQTPSGNASGNQNTSALTTSDVSTIRSLQNTTTQSVPITPNQGQTVSLMTMTRHVAVQLSVKDIARKYNVPLPNFATPIPTNVTKHNIHIYTERETISLTPTKAMQQSLRGIYV